MQRGRIGWRELHVSPVSDPDKPSLAFPLNGRRCGSTKEGGFQIPTSVRVQGGKKAKESRNTCQSRMAYWLSSSAGELNLISSATISVTTVKCNFCINRNGG